MTAAGEVPSGTAAPVPGRTPSQPALATEMVRAALVVAVNGGPPTRAADAGGPVRIRVDPAGDVARFVLEVTGDRAEIGLDPVEVDGTPWRDGWAADLVRPGPGTAPETSWTLVAGGEPARVDGAGGALLSVRPGLRRRRLSRRLGCGEPTDEEAVPVTDLAFDRPTRQSTAGPPPGRLAWAAPTLAEQAPWWEIDLGASAHVAAIRVHLSDVPAGAVLTVAAFAFRTPDGAPPPGCFERTVVTEPAAARSRGTTVAVAAGTVARLVRVALRRPDGGPVVLAVTGVEVLGAPVFAGSLRSTLRRAFALHGERALFVSRRADGSYAPQHTYAQVWTRSMALARGLARRLEPARRPDGRVVLAIAMRNRPEWVMADLAALERGYVVVPLAPDAPDDRSSQLLQQARPDAVVCEPADADRLARLGAGTGLRLIVACGDGQAAEVPVTGFDQLAVEGERASVPPAPARPDGDVYVVLFTSGSTGRPKGAMHSYATFYGMVASTGAGHHPRHLSFQPLSHLSERVYLPWVLAHAGEVGFAADGVHLIGELRAFQPTAVLAAPRLFDVLYADYRRRVTALATADPATVRQVHESRARAEARRAFGDRLLWLSVGSAPISPEVLGFLRETFVDLHVIQGYGSTEVGVVAVDGVVQDGVEVKLVPLAAPGPAPGHEPVRAELWVRSPRAITGYLGEEDGGGVVDDEGFLATGDLGERGPDGRVRVVGRLRSAVKLAQGEFVSGEAIEGALGVTPVVDRIYVHVEAGASGVVAVVFPDAGELGRLLGRPGADAAALARDSRAASVVLAELHAQGRQAGLPGWELPRAILLETVVPTIGNGLLTDIGKLARGVLADRYGARLRGRAAGPGMSPDRRPTGGEAARLVAIVADLVGRAVDPHEPLAGWGVDSLATAEILTALGVALGREVPLHAWFAADDLAGLLEGLGHRAGPAAGVMDLVAQDRAAGADLDLAAIDPPQLPPSSVLLTGATGFLGAHLVEALLAHTPAQILCLVRAPDEAVAATRLEQALAGYRIPASERVRAVPADLARPALGLSEPAFDRLRAEADLVLHAGARVSWLAPYATLRGPNVRGTIELLRLAGMDRARPVHFISTIGTVPPGGDERTGPVPLDAAAAQSPYGLSKWVAEEQVRRAGVAGLPVAVYRPGIVGPHSRRGLGNPDDFVHRYVVGAVELGRYLDLPDVRLEMAPVDYVAEAVVALVLADPLGRAAPYHLTNVDQSPSYAEIGRALQRAGLAVEPASYAEFRAALLGGRGARLTALAGYFPERPEDGSGLATGPWPCSRTAAAVGRLGVVRPRVDDAAIGRMVRALRRRGLLPGLVGPGHRVQ